MNTLSKRWGATPEAIAALNRHDYTTAPPDAAELAAEANRRAEQAAERFQHPRWKNAPILTASSGSERIAQWLEWCFGNTNYEAHRGLADGSPPLTLDEAWHYLREELKE